MLLALDGLVASPLPRDRRGGALLARVHRLSGGQSADPASVEKGPLVREDVVEDEAMPTEAPMRVPTENEQVYSELVGTFLLSTAAVNAGTLDSPLGPIGVAGVLIGLIYAFGPIGKAVFNPAISVTLVMRNRLSVGLALKYTAAQLLGALLAGLLGFAIHGTVPGPTVSAAAAKAGAAGLLRAGMQEMLFTGIIANAVCHSGTTRYQEGSDVVPLSIGLTVMGCIICSSYSGACFNPAISLGLQLAGAVTSGAFPVALGEAAMYLIAPSLGGALATLPFNWLTCPNEP